MLDVCIACVGLLIFSLTFPVLAFLIKRDGGPVFYGQERIGKNGKVFTCWKLRTMVVDADARLQALLDSDPVAKAEWDASCKLKDDPRSTVHGDVLRRLSIDELPQFYNVLRGEMSVVGPRPVTLKERGKYSESWGECISVRPGITGLWQVSGRSNTTYSTRVRLDRLYVRRWGFWLDILILAKTPMVVFRRRGAY